MTGAAASQVQPGDWGPELARLAADGFDFLDFLTVVDKGSTLLVVVRCKRSDGGAAAMRMTEVPPDQPRLASATDAYPGAAWHERESREMFGIEFVGLMDDRGLLLRDPAGQPPMRKAQLLQARLDRLWPGAAEPDVGSDGRRAGNPSRRRQLPLGIPQDQGRPER